jgi:hypothetical protein
VRIVPQCGIFATHPVTGQAGHFPATNLGSIEILTHAGATRARFIVRANLELGPPIRVYPFEIVKITNGESPAWRWRGAHFDFPIAAAIPDFNSAEFVLKRWVQAVINQRPHRTQRGRDAY